MRERERARSKGESSPHPMTGERDESFSHPSRGAEETATTHVELGQVEDKDIEKPEPKNSHQRLH